MYEKLTAATRYIQSIRTSVPQVGIVLGSGLGWLTDEVQNRTAIPYSEIPYFAKTTIKGHEGQLILGELCGVKVAILQGRVHFYEGHSMEEVVFPVRVLSTLGVESLILSNAAGGINYDYRPGDLVLIEDHINLMAHNPLIGPNIAELGPRFPDMTTAYEKHLRDVFIKVACDIGLDLKSGVYCALLGPTYETPAEIRMLRALGADLVGMSTVPEVIAANHLGLKVAAISCVTNLAAGMSGKKLDHEEVKVEASKAMKNFTNLLKGVLTQLSK
ncbi:MAG: purine-nucleoside phosphorylase [Oligoflexia bacterium]|nr:purine-nucleoside phosphorylase [Oligoflexia bacterium]MBF0367685.1 purine-nucleoside phosphorylase [Oligoflexia bacterium]